MKIILQGNTPSSKNSKQIVFNPVTKRRFVISNKNTLKWNKENLPILQSLNIKFTSHVEMHVTVFRKSKHKWDWQNIIQAVADILVKAEILIDDDVTHCTPVYKGWAYDKENPRCEVDIIICEGKEMK